MAATGRHLALANTPAELQDVEQFADGLPDAFLECRTYGHNWRPIRAQLDDGAYQLTLRCPRCRAERLDWLSVSGHLLKRQMRYEEGYLSKEIGRLAGPARDVMRVQSIKRVVDRMDASTTGRAAPAKLPPRQRGRKAAG